MKKKILSLIVLFISIFFLFSCKKKDNYNISGEASIILTLDKYYEDLQVSCPTALITKTKDLEYKLQLSNLSLIQVVISAPNYENKYLVYQTKDLKSEIRETISLEKRIFYLELIISNVDSNLIEIENSNIFNKVSDSKKTTLLSYSPLENVTISADGYKPITLNFASTYFNQKSQIKLRLLENNQEESYLIFINDLSTNTYFDVRVEDANNSELIDQHFFNNYDKNFLKTSQLEYGKGYIINASYGKRFPLYNNLKGKYYIYNLSELMLEESKSVMVYLENLEDIMIDPEIFLEDRYLNVHWESINNGSNEGEPDQFRKIVEIPINSVGKKLFIKSTNTNVQENFSPKLKYFVVTNEMLNTKIVKVNEWINYDTSQPVVIDFEVVGDDGNPFPIDLSNLFQLAVYAQSNGVQIKQAQIPLENIIHFDESEYDNPFTWMNIEGDIEIREELNIHLGIYFNRDMLLGFNKHKIVVSQLYKVKVKTTYNGQVIKDPNQLDKYEGGESDYYIDNVYKGSTIYLQFNQNNQNTINYFKNVDIGFYPELYVDNYNEEDGYYYIEREIEKIYTKKLIFDLSEYDENTNISMYMFLIDNKMQYYNMDDKNFIVEVNINEKYIDSDILIVYSIYNENVYIEKYFQLKITQEWLEEEVIGVIS